MTKTKITDLPLESIVEFNGFDYEYKGQQKRRQKGIGTAEYFIFYSEDLKSEKLLPKFKFLKHELKQDKEKYIF